MEFMLLQFCQSLIKHFLVSFHKNISFTLMRKGSSANINQVISFYFFAGILKTIQLLCPIKLLSFIAFDLVDINSFTQLIGFEG